MHISFVKAFSSLDEFEYRHQGSFLGYLHRILRNEVASKNRRWISKKPSAPLNGEHRDSAPMPDDDLIAAERMDLYERALATLSGRDQELIRMREMGLKHSEIAEEAGFDTANAARMAVTRAIERLAHAIQG